MMITVCPQCGYERTGGCVSCNSSCPVCGMDLERIDLVRHVLKKQMKAKKDEKRDS